MQVRSAKGPIVGEPAQPIVRTPTRGCVRGVLRPIDGNAGGLVRPADVARFAPRPPAERIWTLRELEPTPKRASSPSACKLTASHNAESAAAALRREAGRLVRAGAGWLQELPRSRPAQRLSLTPRHRLDAAGRRPWRPGGARDATAAPISYTAECRWMA